MNRVCALLINHYYTLIVALGLTDMLGFRDMKPLLILLTIYAAYISVKRMLFSSFDILVISWILYCLLSSLWNDDAGLAYYGIKSELIPVLFYFIARGKYCGRCQFLDNMQAPLLFAFTSALILFFFPPSWYISYKTQNLATGISEKSYYEATRLSGFWVWSYFIGYASLFYIMYQTKKIIIDQIKSKYFTIGFPIACLCLFLAQQRASIAFFFIYIIALVLYSLFTNGNENKTITILIIFSIAVFFIIYIFNNFVDSGYIGYILERTINKDENLVQERFDLFSQFNKDFTIFGSGIGTMGHHMLALRNKDSITDCDYLRIPNEYGVLGATLLFAIIIIALTKGLHNIKFNWFNLFVLLFLLVAMIGAAPLEAYMLEPYLYWYCIGLIEKSCKLKYGKKIYWNNHPKL